MNEADALVLDRSMRFSEQETALEQGWLLQELEQRFGYSLEELARRFDRSVSWVSRRLALVELLPEAIQQQVREGRLGAQLARSEEHTSELQSLAYLVCRLLLEKKKKNQT